MALATCGVMASGVALKRSNLKSKTGIPKREKGRGEDVAKSTA